MQHSFIAAGVLCGAVVLATGCAGYAEVDGYDAVYVDNPPPYVEYYPRYRFHDGYVYEVRGRYYHEHHGRWTVYRGAPSEIRYAHHEVRGDRGDRGRAERQR